MFKKGDILQHKDNANIIVLVENVITKNKYFDMNMKNLMQNELENIERVVYSVKYLTRHNWSKKDEDFIFKKHLKVFGGEFGTFNDTYEHKHFFRLDSELAKKLYI